MAATVLTATKVILLPAEMIEQVANVMRYIHQTTHCEELKVDGIPPPPFFSISNCNSTLIFPEQLLSKYIDRALITTVTFDVPCLEKTKEHSQDSIPQTSKPVADALPLYNYLLTVAKERFCHFSEAVYATRINFTFYTYHAGKE